MFFFYGWLASLFYSGAVGALAVSVDYHCFSHCEEFDSKMSFWVLIGMLILPVALAAGILCTYAICRIAGRRGGSYLRIVV